MSVSQNEKIFLTFDHRIFVTMYLLIFFALFQNIYAMDSKHCELSGSLMTCSNVDVEELVEEINILLAENFEHSVSTLTLSGIRFKDSEIEEGWLNVSALEISTLIVENTALSNIHARAFSGRPFTALTTLRLGNTEIDSFTKNIFDDAILTSLSIYYETFRPVIFEEDVFGSISETLRILHLQGCVQLDALHNVTGSRASLPLLIYFQSHLNHLGELLANSFVGVPNLQVLYLSQSSITDIEPGTFDVPILERLDLSMNQLQSLPENLFRFVRTGISLYGNPWNCNCGLVWLRDLLINSAQLFTHQNFNCYTPEGYVSYKLIDFCPANETAYYKIP